MALHQLKYPYRKFILPMAKKISWINPDVFSWMAFVVTFCTGYCFYAGNSNPKLYLYVILLIFLRMTLNTLDGVVAIQRGDDNRIHGKIINALPDRYGDIFIVGGILLSPICNDLIGLLGLGTMFLVSYSGMLGKALGVSWQGHGPLDKVERLVLLMCFAYLQYRGFSINAPQLQMGDYSFYYVEICMLLFFVLGQITVLRRVHGIYKEDKELNNNLEKGKNE